MPAKKHKPAEESVAAPAVATIILNYNSPWETMDKCLASLAAQTYARHEIILVDNASTHDILDRVAAQYPGVRQLRLEKNLGFSGGINRGVAAAADADFVCLLNFDTFVEPDFIEQMVAVASAGDRIAGVAPKMMLAGLSRIFDSVGTSLGDNAGAFNLGIGQPDIGQYDASERVFGSCFGATLLRRSAFADDSVGQLDDSYFMYFEDVDWCFRANLLGWEFRTAPAAVVHHEHSASVKGRKYNFKYKLIELNLLRTVVKNYQRRQAVMISYRRLKVHLRNALLNGAGSRATSLAIAAGFLADLPRLLPQRWEIQRRRQVKDQEILKLSFTELPYYDPTRYQPFYSLDALMAAYRRLHVLTGSQKAYRIWKELEMIAFSKLKFEPEILERRLRDLLAGQPEHVLEFASRLTLDYGAISIPDQPAGRLEKTADTPGADDSEEAAQPPEALTAEEKV